MRTQYFEYLAPSSIEEAVKMLKEYEEAKILAGGQSLIPLLKTRITVFPYLVSLSSIPGLSYISLDKDKLRLGPMTVVSDIEYSGDLMKRLPVLTEAASQIADPLVRNMGTVGGNVSHADPSNDMPPVMLALRARFTVQGGPSGTREIRASDFFVDTFQTAMNHDEILREISVDLPEGAPQAPT
ncbi:FAD binding domain-containing protein [Thermogymnomonas acidicola]|uniref:FAD binding domain-containing protein n=1 Tax=Thermogymnomonas acidicola TaxID=399579 RepID=UPI000A5DF973|nr:FAD binding domain-containing protein [Thermogymnomonas acidicola]